METLSEKDGDAQGLKRTRRSAYASIRADPLSTFVIFRKLGKLQATTGWLVRLEVRLALCSNSCDISTASEMNTGI